MFTINLSTNARSQFVDITRQVQKAIAENGMTEGFCHIWVPHTTAGLTINENADPDVVNDIIAHLDRMVPGENNYHHGEGNSAAHIKSSLMGCQLSIPVKEARLQVGTWQGIYFCEFDGPRKRQIWINFLFQHAN
jgi:secondary thiamine-phosphate synthase enzyme